MVGNGERAVAAGASAGGAPEETRRVTVFYDTATTLDGYLADEQNSLAWLFEVPTDGLPGGGDEGGVGDVGSTGAEDEDPWAHSPVGRADVVVSGSTTYEWVVEEEQVRLHPEKWADFFGGRPYFVFSSRELWTPPGHDVRIISGSVADRLPEILAAAASRSDGADGVVWLVGGGELVGQFFDARSLDRVEVSVAPATLGAGAPLLPRRIGSAQLTLDKVEKQGQFARLEYTVSYPGQEPGQEPGVQD